MANKYLEILTVGGGCFWCLEAILNEVNGVEKVISGYTGGTVPGIPTYREVCSGLTGHAEVVQVTFDASIISYEDLLFIFMTSHDPTTLNSKEAYMGSQYRSVIYYNDDHQKVIAETVVKKLSTYFERPITTKVSPKEKFHIAEAYHQDYYAKNEEAAYCKAIITPKLAKLREEYSDQLKKHEKSETDAY
ncbi:MAG: peptide-methionine (S)-S-oxide reductase MsrA [Aquaticitalea sp.]